MANGHREAHRAMAIGIACIDPCTPRRKRNLSPHARAIRARQDARGTSVLTHEPSAPQSHSTRGRVWSDAKTNKNRKGCRDRKGHDK
eukprot:5522790-Prymnesium_polylepis.1